MTTPNAELAYLVLDHIDAHPDLWRQRWWLTVKDCGTAACFAGWACLLSGDQASTNERGFGDHENEFSKVELADGAVMPVLERAADLLNIDLGPADNLFDALNDREDLGLKVAEIFGPRPEPTA